MAVQSSASLQHFLCQDQCSTIQAAQLQKTNIEKLTSLSELRPSFLLLPWTPALQCSGLWMPASVPATPNSAFTLLVSTSFYNLLCLISQVCIIPNPGSIDYAKTFIVLIHCKVFLFCKFYSLKVQYHHIDSLALYVSTARSCKNVETSLVSEDMVFVHLHLWKTKFLRVPPL